MNIDTPTGSAVGGLSRASSSPHERDQNRPAGIFSKPLIPIMTAMVVAVLTMVLIRMGSGSNNVVVVWAANAVAVGVWLRFGRGVQVDLGFGGLMAFGILAGEMLANYALGHALLLTAANMVEIGMAVWLVRRVAPEAAIISVRTAILILSSLVAAAAVGGLAGSLGLMLVWGVDPVIGAPMWMLSHALGYFLIVPLILSCDLKLWRELSRPARAAEAVVLLGLVAVLSYLVSFVFTMPLAFVVNPVLLVIAVRLRVNGVAIAMLIVTLSLLISIVYGAGPPRTVDYSEVTRVVTAQVMLMFAIVPYLLVSALMEERDRLWVQARAGLARAVRMSESKSRLLANVAHEIKSPVAGIIGIGELWSSGRLGPVNAQQVEMSEMLVSTARQVETLAHDLLDVARAESGKLKVELRPTEMVGLVEDVRRSASVRPEARAVRIQVTSSAPAHIALVDSQRTRQVIDNLVVNALKYGGMGGVVTLNITPCALGVRVEVIDRGPGLSAEKQAQLFEPFNRLGLERSAIEGHGVGLALARRLIELQAGEIGVVSEPGKGATFWFEVPSA